MTKWMGLWVVGVLGLVGCDGDVVMDDAGPPVPGQDAGPPAPGTDAGPPAPGARPHPQYPALDLDTLPGDGGGAEGAYQPPTEPMTTREVTISQVGTDARDAVLAECQAGGVRVTVPDAAGRIGVLNLGNVQDCDVRLGAEVVVDYLVVGSLPGPMHAPAHRVRVVGGQIGAMLIRGGSSDLIFDSIALNNGVQPSAQRNGAGIYMPSTDEGEVVERVVFVNSFLRMLPVDQGNGFGGCGFLGRSMRDVMFAGNNVVTAGNNNSWGFRLSGAHNFLLIDNHVRVSFHKLVRMNDAPVDYVVIRGGTWMREATLSSTGGDNNDAFAQLSGSTTDHVYIEDLEVFFLSERRAAFGMTYEAEQAGRSWEARRITWHARSEEVMSAARLDELETYCTEGAVCDYASETHTFVYDPGLQFPDSPWRDLPAFDDDDPDRLPQVD